MIGLPTSDSFVKFQGGISEVTLLQRESRRSKANWPLWASLNRAETLFLSSVLEAYIESLYLEAWNRIEEVGSPSSTIPSRAKVAVFESETNRLLRLRTDPSYPDQIEAFVLDHMTLWANGMDFNVDSSRLWRFADTFNNPNARNVRRLFQHLGSDDIFSEIEILTGGQLSARKLCDDVDEIVSRRNEISHGDVSIVPTDQDVSRYVGNLRRFSRHLDLAVGDRVRAIIGVEPWNNYPVSCIAVRTPEFAIDMLERM